MDEFNVIHLFMPGKAFIGYGRTQSRFQYGEISFLIGIQRIPGTELGDDFIKVWSPSLAPGIKTKFLDNIAGVVGN